MRYLAFVVVPNQNEGKIAGIPPGWLCGETWGDAVLRVKNTEQPSKIYLAAPIIEEPDQDLAWFPDEDEFPELTFYLLGDSWMARRELVQIVAGPWEGDEPDPWEAKDIVREAYKAGYTQIGLVFAWALAASPHASLAEYREEFASLIKEKQSPPPPPQSAELPPLDELERIIYDPHRATRERIEAVRLLPRYGKEAARVFRHIFFGGIRIPREVQYEASGHLSGLAEEAIPIMEAIVRNGWLFPEILKAAADLGNAAIHIIKASLQSRYIEMRVAAIWAAARIGNPDLLEEALEIPDPRLWEIAVEAAGWMGYWPIVQRCLERQNIRAAAVRAAGYFGEAAIPILEAALDEESAEIRAAALDAAGRIGPAALHIVERGLEDKNTRIQVRALEILEKFGAIALPILGRAMASEHLRRIAYRIAVGIASGTNIALMVSLIEQGVSDPQEDIRTIAASIATVIGHPRAIFAALKSPWKDVRVLARTAIDVDKLARKFVEAVREEDLDSPYTALLARAVYEYKAPIPPVMALRLNLLNLV